MNDNKCKDKIKYILESSEFQVSEVPTSHVSTPDLLVQDKCGNSYLIEIKEKFDSGDHIKQRSDHIKQSQNFVNVKKILPWNTLSGIATDAYSVNFVRNSP